MTPEQYNFAVCERMRHVRQELRLSLERIEEKSGGRFKGVVIGSYERGDRAMTAECLSEYARFLGVPVLVFLPEPAGDRAFRELAVQAMSRRVDRALATAGAVA